MSQIIQSSVNLNAQECEFIEMQVLGNYFPWYWVGGQTVIVPPPPVPLGQNSPYFSHTLLRRPEDRTGSSSDHSKYLEPFIEIFHRWTLENDISYSKILRANLNLNIVSLDGFTVPHVDHDYPHFNFIMYLDDSPDADTVIFSNDFSQYTSYSAVKYTAITFNAQWHAHKYPKPGTRRTVFVLTYI
jgi:hypothetical protein